MTNKTYTVKWLIELDADSPKEAAELALQIHRDNHAIANVFEVTNEQGTSTEIDLSEKTT